VQYILKLLNGKEEARPRIGGRGRIDASRRVGPMNWTVKVYI